MNRLHVSRLVLSAVVLIAATGMLAWQAKPVTKADRLNALRGTAWVDAGGMTACAVGPAAHATARLGNAAAVVPGSSAVAFAPAKACGGPGTTITLLGRRADGSAAGITLAPGRTAQAWTWYTLTDSGTFRVVGAVSASDKAAFEAASKGAKE